MSMKVWFDGREQKYTTKEAGIIVHYDDAALVKMDEEKHLPDEYRTQTIVKHVYGDD